ncbi:MAG: hypothetical protein RL567_1200 [Bacteroidota bacterium]|jgi:hypothetical protein
MIENPILQTYDTANPYRNSLKNIFDRLKWDIDLESWKSRLNLKKLHNRHRGQNAVILCNGPSLLKTDFNLLKDTYTFGLNKINLLFDKNDFRPNSIVAVNKFVVEQNKFFFNKTQIPLFIDSLSKQHIKSRDNVTFLHSTNQVKFARDVSVSLWQGATVTNVALQLAFHMGFENVALVGCDHNFAVKGPANQIVISGEKDESHFDPNYFARGLKWQLPDLVASEYGYALARETFKASGRNIYNCTVGGELEVFERKLLSDFCK